MVSEESRKQSPWPDRIVEHHERFRLLQCALLELPEDKRELLILARFQEMNYPTRSPPCWESKWAQ